MYLTRYVRVVGIKTSDGLQERVEWESLRKTLNFAFLLSPGNETGTVTVLYHLIQKDTGKLNFLFFFSSSPNTQHLTGDTDRCVPQQAPPCTVCVLTPVPTFPP